MTDPLAEKIGINVQGGTVNVQNLNIGIAERLAESGDRVRILVVAANPLGSSPLKLDHEVKTIQEALRRSRKRDNFVVEYRLAATPSELRRALLDVEPHVLHFSGHGAGEQGLLFVSDESAGAIYRSDSGEVRSNSNEIKFVPAQPLANLLRLCDEHLECVVLNACYSDEQGNAISANIPFTIGMRDVVDDNVAIKFSQGFYDALGAGKSYEMAFEWGKVAIEFDLANDEATKILILRKKGETAIQTPVSALSNSEFNRALERQNQGDKERSTTESKEANPDDTNLILKQQSLPTAEWKFMVIAGRIVFFISGIVVLIFVAKYISSTTNHSQPNAANHSNAIASLNLKKLEKLNTSLRNPDVLEMDGSTTMVKLIRDLIILKLIRDLTFAYPQEYPKLRITYGVNNVTPSGSSKGLENLVNGTISLAATSRKLNNKEEDSGLQSFQIGRDAIGIVVGINNPFTGNLTKKELRDIYSGEITNWSSVGGSNLPIRVINRGITSGTRKDFQDIVLLGQNFAPDGEFFKTWLTDETTEILSCLNGVNSVEISCDGSGISYATVTQLKNQPVRIIAIDGVSPTDETLKSGNYPLIRDLFLVVRKTTSPSAAEFIRLALSPEGQRIVEKTGFLPINPVPY